LLNHEKKAFLKFFTTYFGSVALLILASGFFYFAEQKKSMIEKEHFSMIEYVRQIKMKQTPQNPSGISYEIQNITIENFNMNNFDIQEKYFVKYMPYSWEGGYLLVKKDKSIYYKNLFVMKIYIIATQLILLLLFALLSYFLSARALRPMQDAIVKLDNFSKDLIHDLNTPITSILLNMKLLDKKGELEQNKALLRIKRSVEDISELHNNLSVLLQEETMLVQKHNLFVIVNEVISIHQHIYKDINFYIADEELFADVNANAFKQILMNLISNACKYNKEGGFIKVYAKSGVLYIEDSGVGIKNIDEVFVRSYKEHKNGNGIGLDIVKRLCEAMQISIEVHSQKAKGTLFLLRFNT
jgi:two-component system OmpR family sensor kinase